LRILTLSILSLLLLTACSKERQTLNQIEGTFETVEFVVTASGTDSVLFTASPTLEFDECAPRDTRCMMSVVDSDGTVYNYRFDYNRDPASGVEQISFNPADGETFSLETELNQAVNNFFDFELNDGELTLYSEDRQWTRDSLQGLNLCDISITAVKR
jgi:hypothetical protein